MRVFFTVLVFVALLATARAQIQGACCFRNDQSSFFGQVNAIFQKTCIVTTEDDCDANFGVYQGDNSECPVASLVNDMNVQSPTCSCCEDDEVLLKAESRQSGFEVTFCVQRDTVFTSPDFDFYHPVCSDQEEECEFELINETPADDIVAMPPSDYDETCLFNKGGQCQNPVQNCEAFPVYGSCCILFERNIGFNALRSVCSYTTESQCLEQEGRFVEGSYCPQTTFLIDHDNDEQTPDFEANVRGCPCCPDGFSYGLVTQGLNGETIASSFCFDNDADVSEGFPPLTEYVFVCEEGNCDAVEVTGRVGDVENRQDTCALQQGGTCSEQTFTCPPTPVEKIDAILECVREEGEGQFVAVFGYNNFNTQPVFIPVGDDNEFTPTPQDRGQTTFFLPGRQVSAFEVPFDGNNLVWTLRSPNGDSETVTASSQSQRCPECEVEQEVVCNAALKSECVVAGGQNVLDKLGELAERLDNLEDQ